jgi:transposase-like protein
MKPISYARHRFPPDVIRHAIWLYLRFTLGYRDVEDLLAERGLEVSNETIRRWVLKFGSAIARNRRSVRPRPIDAFIQDAGRLCHQDVRRTIKASARRD